MGKFRGKIKKKTGEKESRFSEEGKKTVMTYAVFIIASILCLTVVFNYYTAYRYSYNGRVLGMVKDQRDVIDTARLLYDEGKGGEADETVKDIIFKKVSSAGRDVDTGEKVLERLRYMKDINTKGCAVTVDGKKVAVMENVRTAQKMLDDIKAMYAPQGEGKSSSVSFGEQVELEDTDTKLGEIKDSAEVKKLLLADSGKGPLLTCRTEEVRTSEEKVPYATEVKATCASMYDGISKTVQKGRDGAEQVTARIYKSNGRETARVVISSKIVKNPVTKIVITGGAKGAALKGTGNFQDPVPSARLTSKFGKRWGRLHEGIDLAEEEGTPIKASDGGIVICAEDKGTFGNLVMIDHGKDRVTYYGHCSKLLVKAGQMVRQGETVALLGNTGRSTGPHCHFQIEINGKVKNPLKYLARGSKTATSK